MKTVRVEASGSYDVMIGSGILDRAGELLGQIMAPCKAAIITDDVVQELFAQRVEASLQRAATPIRMWKGTFSQIPSSVLRI